ncbi:type II toxin-antitoxin system RelE/ParE family toxin [Ciceribacter thiooxidans]|uniref:Type II toxin-antitoxin system RelE/ParE family toxin n=1 Tax=Ciceribacter thiooxidans TaxID=1969821 RepID=A0ABV7I3I0_9HYPH|nr:type II toxin-antitoxin system RelE/ParE family toxin [Ciceribacter thiooxidans]MDI6836999.1 type II toxin-antitoxin system RelE/ParE family toxin [Rhizobiaceae bacterium]
MGRILRRPLFVDDVRSVWTFIAADSHEEADKFVRALEQRYTMLASNPLLGTRRFPNHPNTRLFPFRRYLIIYQPLSEGDGIELIRLLHAARDYRRFFDD